MEGHVNTYGGMNKDTAYDTIKQNMYIDALDIRISTDKGESQGAFTNIKGNEYSFTIPTSGTFNGKSWTAAVPEIIGYGTIRDTIILFVADDSGTKGWIYKVEYDPATREVPSGATLLYYSGNLNFKKEWPIEALGRYENASTQRIYWTDYNNIFRTINIANPNLDTFPVENVDIYPNIEYTQPILQSVSGGGALNSGMYQIAYRLITSDGKETLISPPSNMIHIVTASETNSVPEYIGEPEKIDAQKIINIELDTTNYVGNFEKIEFFSLYYENDTATPVATSIEVKDLISNTTSLLYSGTETTIFDIELFTFTSKNFAFKTFKSVTQKDNYLVGANIKSSTISIQDLLESGESFDAKSRRYNSTLGTPFPNTTEQNKLNNAFNTGFNEDKHWDVTWQTAAKQYKYQADGTTLGGGDPTPITGDNISYTFHLEPMTVDIDYQAKYHNVGGNIHYGIDNHDLNDGYGVRPNPGSSIPNSASPIVSSLLRGYKRGETYRFGIIFYTLKGEATYVEYIGDIKFPDISEANGVNNTGGSPYWPLSTVYDDTTGTIGKIGAPITVGLTLGIQFKIDLSSCPQLTDKIESYQIVRVPRENADKRRLSQGIMTPYAYNSIGTSPTSPDYDFRINGSDEKVLHHWNTPRLYKYDRFTGTIPQQTSVDIYNDTFLYFIDEQDNNGVAVPYTDYNNVFPSAAGAPMPAVNSTLKSQYLAFYSPEMSYNYNNIPDLATSNNASLLVTGCYTLEDSPSPPSAADYRKQYTPAAFPSNGPEEANIGSNGQLTLWDHGFKFRRVGPVTFNSIENIKRIRSSHYFDMRDSTNVWLDTKTALFLEDHVRNITGSPLTQMPSRDFPLTGNSAHAPTLDRGDTYVRNYYAMVGRPKNNNPPPATYGINNPASGGIDRSCGVARAGTNLSVLVDYYDVDPLDASNTYTTPGTDQSWRDYFLVAGNTSHSAAINAQIAPLPVPDGSGGTTTINRDRAIPIVDLVLPKKEVYGGYTTNALESNVFIPASPVIDKTQLNPIVYGGDIFISMFNCQKAQIEFNSELYNAADYESMFVRNDLMVTESTINLNLNNSADTTRGIKFKFNGNGPEQELEAYRQEDNNSFSTYGKKDPGLDYYKTYSYNSVFSKVSDQVLFFIKPSTLTDLSLTNDVRSFLSFVKVNGENIDSWTKFGINDYYDVDDHGPINKILNFKDDVYFIQDKGIGNYSINREAITTTDDGVPTELGTAKGWGKHRYLSKEVGSMHQWAVAATNNAIYFFDAIHRKIYQLGQSKTGLQTSPLSELKGMHSYLQFLGDDVFTRKEDGGDNPILLKGAHIGIDQINNEVLFTFLSTAGRGESNSIMFDEVANEFASRLSINPKIWINNGDTLLTSNTFDGAPTNLTNEVFIHNIGNWGEFYRTQTECELTLVINPKADVNKVLRFLEFNSIVRGDDKVIDRTQTITAFKITTEYQDSSKIPYSAGRIKRRFDKWRIKLPRDTTTNGRFRSTHFLLTLYFDNTTNKELIMNRLISYYDPQIF